MAKRFQTRSLAAVLVLTGASSAFAQAWVDPPANADAPAQAAPAAPAAPAVPGPTTAPEPARPFQDPPVVGAIPPAPATRPEPTRPVEPPARRDSGPAAIPARPPQERARLSPPEQPRGDRLDARASAAQDLAIDYLRFWSASNAQALDAAPDFYAPRVVFHGRMMTDRSLLEEKRRFVQRWPERDYRHRENTMRVSCDPGGHACTVQSIFDFTAVNKARGKRSQGAATLELVVSFAGDKPVIASENSLVHNRRPGGSDASLEDEGDD